MTTTGVRRQPRAGRFALAICALVLAGIGAGCSDVKEGLEEADKTLSEALLGEDQEEMEGVSGTALADALYEKGLRLRSEGKEAEAVARFQAAADRGHAAAAYELAESYNKGRGVGQDSVTGARWMNAAAERGDPRAQYALGAALYRGNGVGQDYVRAVQYLTSAAEQGHPDAQFLLGECYANGRGVTKNLAWAARWYGKSAAQGQTDGAFSYGVVHAAGLGLPVNLPLGYAWLDVASKGGHGQAGEVRAAIANKMTPEEISEGKSRAAAFSRDSSSQFADRPTVMYVQHSLNQLGFNAGAVDGLMGPRTRGAINAYLSSIGDTTSEAAITPPLLQRLLESQQNAA